MPFLNDQEIAGLLRAAAPLTIGVDPTDFKKKTSPVQACSLDLTVGDIFDPAAKPGRPGSKEVPLKKLSLDQGATALIRTSEKLAMPHDVGGIAFPPSHVSIDGLLMTNPGHVDPGYDGHLHLTVINMGSKAFSLKAGDRIVRVLLFRLGHPPAQSYRQRRPGLAAPYITEELLSRLSDDFLDVTKRADESAKRAIRGAQITAAIWVPILAALVGGAATWGINKLTSPQVHEIERKVDALDAKVNSLGGEVNLGTVENRIEILEKKVGS